MKHKMRENIHRWYPLVIYLYLNTLQDWFWKVLNIYISCHFIRYWYVIILLLLLLFLLLLLLLLHCGPRSQSTGTLTNKWFIDNRLSIPAAPYTILCTAASRHWFRALFIFYIIQGDSLEPPLYPIIIQFI